MITNDEKTRRKAAGSSRSMTADVLSRGGALAKNGEKTFYNKTEKMGIYIHVPICFRKCFYCDFYSVTDLAQDGARRRRLLAAMEEELRQVGRWAEGLELSERSYASDGLKSSDRGLGAGKKAQADTVFFGGGTPSLLTGDEASRLLAACREAFEVSGEAEISLECNPASVDGEAERLGEFRRAGVNRLSIGAQSFDDDVLRMLGRLHDAVQIRRTVKAAREAGFGNVSLDLMFGIPGQSMESWEATLSEALALEPEHLSFYSLEFMEGTPFERRRQAGELAETEVEADRRMYWRCRELLEAAGYRQYEISNAAKDGFRCRHNLKYWNLTQYAGIGPSAHSFLKGVRYANFRDVDRYAAAVEGAAGGGKACAEAFCGAEREFFAENSFDDSASEFMFTGLRRTEGVSFADFERIFGAGLWEVFASARGGFGRFAAGGLVWEDEEGIGLTAAGLDVSNRIMSLFV